MRCAYTLIAVGVILAGQLANAATLRVMQDGSGDFADIQAAVDVAARGDTIRIGPGRWDIFHSHLLPGWGYSVYVIALDWEGRDLTFLGSGPDETILGPSPAGHNDWHYRGIMTRYSADRVRGLSVEGIYDGIYDGRGGIYVDNCRFINCSKGLYTFSPEGATVVASEFIGCSYGVMCLDGGDNVDVRDCTFVGDYTGVGLQGAWQATYSVSNCRFDGGGTAVEVLYGHATIQACQATSMVGGTQLAPVYLAAEHAQVHLENCTAQTTGRAVWVSGHASLVGSNVVLEGGHSVVFAREDATVSIHDSHLINAGGYTIEAWYYSCEPDPPEPWVLDLTENYWGTTDIEQIEDWIFIDQEHGPNCVVVDYLPLADGPVQTQRETWGTVKTLFR